MKLYAVIVVTWIHWCIHPFLTIVIAEDDLVDFLGLVAFLNLFKVLGASPITSKPHLAPVPQTFWVTKKHSRDFLILMTNLFKPFECIT